MNSCMYGDFQICISTPLKVIISKKILKTDMPKAFNRAWHESILLKLKHLVFSEKYYTLINSLFSNRH